MTEIKQCKAAQHLLTQPGWSRESARIRAPRRVFGNPPHDASTCCKDAYTRLSAQAMKANMLVLAFRRSHFRRWTSIPFRPGRRMR